MFETNDVKQQYKNNLGRSGNMIFDLASIFDARDNFYGKAKVEVRNFLSKNSVQYTLYSYGTDVAMVNIYKDKKVYHNFGKYSQTTTRHQKEFFKQFGLSDKEIKELFKNGTLKKVL